MPAPRKAERRFRPAAREYDGDEIRAQIIRELRAALVESLKLQSHYARLLNVHDGGKRLTFAEADAWLVRLRQLRARNGTSAP